MLNALSSLLQGIAAVWQLIINIVTSLFNFIINIPTYTNFLHTAITVLPDIVLPFALISITISVTLFVINRQN